ncbi:fungal hydrophobin, partial [Phlegmacium glaucopus]
MKFSTVFAIFATVVSAVSATLVARDSHPDAYGNLTNGERLAKGLPLKRPVHHGGTPTYGPPKSKPSGISNSCNTGPIQCCDSVTTANPNVRNLVEKVAGLVVAADVAVGLTCSPLQVIGAGHTCHSQPVCCENNTFKGVVAIGCSP